MTNCPALTRSPSALRKQGGLGMLAVLLLVAVLSSLGAVGYLEWRARETIKTAQEERQSLSQADTALMTFATINRRFPCPDTNRDGLEDCAGSAQKGWLPSVTMLLAGADPGVGVGQLRYLVQRGATAYDLASLADDWRPLAYDDGAPATFNAMRSTTGADAYQANILTLADLCQRLEVGSASPLTAGMAQVTSTPARAVAYALVHPGMTDTDGDGSLFEGVNGAATGNTFESPVRTQQLSAYDDRVLERSFGSLHTAFDCQPLFQSINTVALGLDVVDQVDGMRADNIDAALRSVIFAALGAAITSVELAAAAIEAASDSGNAAAEYAACVASLGIAVNFCSAAPIHTGSAITAGVSAVANGVSVALNVTAAVLAGNALALADSSSPPSAQSCPTIDLTGPLQTTQNEVTVARSDRTSIQNAYNAKVVELNNANATYNTARNNLYGAARNWNVSSAIDDRVTYLIDAANNWNTNTVTYENAQGTTTGYRTAYNSANDLVNKYNSMLTNRTALITQLEAEIAALDIQIAATTDPAAKQALQTTRNNKAGELGLLNDVTTLTQERDKAITDRAQALLDWNAAIAAESTALTNRNAALTTYQTRYSELQTASLGPYAIQTATLSTVTACTEPAPTPPVDCPAGSVVTSGNVAAYTQYLMGYFSDNGSLQPNANSAFMRPKQLQRELDALQLQLNAANTRVSDAEARLADLQAQLANPPACNISGSAATPWAPSSAGDLLINVDAKGGTR